MTKIELREGYFIEVDEMNATLKQKYTGKTKEGDEKECEKTIGYYSKPTDAMERFVVLNRTDKMQGMELSIGEYVDELKKADKEVLEFLQTLKQMGE